MTPESKRERARILRMKAEGKSAELIRQIDEIARQLEVQANLQERASDLPGPNGSEPRHVPKAARGGTSHEA